MKFLKLVLAASVLAAPIVAHADQIITFEGYAPYTVFTNQFPGVDFNGATVLTADQGLNSQFPPHSGVNVVYNPSGPMTVDFSTAVQFFSGYFTYNEPLTVQAFDGATLLDTYNGVCTANYIGSGTGCSPNEFGEVTGADITSVVISGGGGNNFTLDDAEFTGSVNTGATPEPSSLVLLGTGILGMAGAARRRFGK